MDSEEDTKVAQTSIIEESLAELFNFVEQLEQQVKHKQYCCQPVIDTSNIGNSTAIYVNAIAETQSFESAIDDELNA